MDAITPRARRWIKYLIAIVVGNFVYLVLSPHLPPAAQHQPYHADIGLFVDLWFCVAIYGLIELLVFLAQRIRR
jgi:H+/gluconate symporter-like permease